MNLPNTLTGLSSEEKRAMLAQLLQEHRTHADIRDLPESPLRRPPSVPLSSAQRRIWIGCTLSEVPFVYAVQTVLRLQGALDRQRIARALDTLIARHEILRTGYISGEEGVIQVVHPPIACPLTFYSPTDASSPDVIARQDLFVPFDMAQGPMLRASLVKLSADAHLLVLTLHHIAVDGWSLVNVLKELADHYTAYAEGKTPDTRPAPWQYADYALWEQRQDNTAAKARALEFWAETLRGLPETHLPMKRPEKEFADWKGAEVVIDIAPDLTQSLRNLCREKGTTLFCATVAGFLAVLQHYANRDDVAVGTPVANRVRRRFEDICGCFVNMVTLRPHLDPGASFEEALLRLRDTVHEALAHAEIPFETVVDHLHVDRRAGMHPLFQSVFAFHEAPKAALAFGDASAIIEPAPAITTRFDIELHVFDTGTSLNARLIYARERFEASLMRTMLHGWRQVLHCAASSPDTALRDIELWNDREAADFLNRVNDTASDYPRECTVNDLVGEWVGKTPEAIAITAGDTQISYFEMNKRADLLARRLILEGVRAEEGIAVNLPRSVDFVISLLAVLKAGGAYLPLDPESPAARWRKVLEASGARIILTNVRDAHTFKDIRGLNVICCEGDPVAESRMVPGNVIAKGNGRTLAYIIFTSGSTGEPKGVCVEHRSIARLVRQTNYISISPDDIVAHASSPAFDAATFEIWGALANGARLVIIEPQDLFDPSRLQTLLLREQVTVMFLTTALFNQIAQTHPTIFTSLRVLLFGGENAAPAPVAAVRRHCPHTTLIHVYGPTESTTFATYHVVNEVPKGTTTIPIGLPVANTTAYVLDENGRCLPPGVPGELYLGGDGLARAYLNNTVQTNKAFMTCVIPGTAGARLYRTGDRVLQRAEGSIEFIGRVDRQVKIRGYRIEPGEIEHAVRRYPAVADAVVMLREEAGENTLVAYVVPKDDLSLCEADLLRHLRQQVPAYMMPHACIILNSLPLTANGKVDFAALPAPMTASVPAEAGELPRTDTERALMHIWSEILGAPVRDRHQNFFDAGGHSLLAMNLLERVRKEFSRDISAVSFFADPRLSALAAAIDNGRFSNNQGPLQLKDSLVPIQPNGSRPPLFCFWPAGGAVFMYYPLASYLGPEQPLYALQDPALDPSLDPFRNMKDIAAGVVEIIQRVQPHGPYHLCGWCFGGTLAYEVACQLTAAGESVRRLILLDAHAVFEGRSVRRNWGAALSRLVRYLFIGLSLVPATASFVMDGMGLLAIAPEASKRRWGDYVRARYAALMLRRIGAVAVASKSDVLRSMELPEVRRIFYLYYAHEKTHRAYQPGAYAGTVDLLRATELSRFFPTHNDPTLGWSKYVRGSVRVHPIQSNHSQLLGPRGIGQVAACLAQLLEHHE